MMKILVDHNVLGGPHVFGALGEVTVIDGRSLRPGDAVLRDAEILVVRATTRLTEDLVRTAPRLRVIASAAAGTDHIELEGLERLRAMGRQLPLFTAPGSNAESVADYVWLALLHLTQHWERPLNRCSIGIVGLGHCGSAVARRAEAFGMEVLRSDPPLAERDPSFASDPLEDVLGCNIVSLHPSLTVPGSSRHPSHHLVNGKTICHLRPGCLFINMSRGEVVDSFALLKAIDQGRVEASALDVYEREPAPDPALPLRTDLATPHLAGYAAEAKLRGTLQVYRQITEYLCVRPVDAQLENLLAELQPPLFTRPEVKASLVGKDDRAADDAVRSLLMAVHDIEAESEAFKRVMRDADGARRRSAFDGLRQAHRRNELARHRMFLNLGETELEPRVARRLEAFGMKRAFSKEGASAALLATTRPESR